MSKIPYILLVLSLTVATGPFQAKADPSRFKAVDGSLALEFPRDHGSHPDYSTEWWYFTGHLKSESGKTFGFELVFFRIGLKTRSIEENRLPESAWSTNDLYLAHFALTDDAAKKFTHFEKRSRGAFGEAGADIGKLNVWNGEWKATLEGDVMTIFSEEGDTSLALTLSSKKPLIKHGENGLSRKGAAPGEASYYTSFTRLEGNGRLRIGNFDSTVRASAWFDHEITSSDSSRAKVGWDWFAIQLNNGEEVMLYQLRTGNEQPSEFSSGTYIGENGETSPLKREEFSIANIKTWKSPRTGINYPSGWVLEIPTKKLSLKITPTVEDQELSTEQSTGVTYWEGRSLVEGRKEDQKVDGAAYVELVKPAQ